VVNTLNILLNIKEAKVPKKKTKSESKSKLTGKPRKPEASSLIHLPLGVSHPVDIHVGGRLRARRTLLGLAQEMLADAVDLTFQQIQKYERGANRIGASKLFQFTQILGISVAYFFDDLDGKLGDPAAGYQVGMGYKDNSPPERDEMNRRETLELVRAYYQIKDVEKRKALRMMFESLANASEAK